MQRCPRLASSRVGSSWVGGSLVEEKITELKQGPGLPGLGGGLRFQVSCAPG